MPENFATEWQLERLRQEHKNLKIAVFGDADYRILGFKGEVEEELTKIHNSLSRIDNKIDRLSTADNDSGRLFRSLTIGLMVTGVTGLTTLLIVIRLIFAGTVF